MERNLLATKKQLSTRKALINNILTSLINLLGYITILLYG